MLRVDLAANPISHKKNAHDQKMAVFVGNMSYSIEENALHNRFSKVRDESKLFTYALSKHNHHPELTEKVIMECNNISSFMECKNNIFSLFTCMLQFHTRAQLETTIHSMIDLKSFRRLFFQCGAISSVRIVRDAATGIGKGFGYVNFASEDSVEIALTLNGSELDGRKIRVTRCVYAILIYTSSINRVAILLNFNFRCVRKTKPIVELPNSNTSRPNTKKPAQAKKVTRKKLRDMSASAASFQGQSFDDDKKTKKGELNKSGKGKKLNRGEKEKKKLSQKLLKS